MASRWLCRVTTKMKALTITSTSPVCQRINLKRCAAYADYWMNMRRGNASANANGTYYCLKTCSFKSRLPRPTSRCRDRRSSSSKSQSTPRDSSLKPTRDQRGYSAKAIRELLLSIWWSRSSRHSKREPSQLLTTKLWLTSAKRPRLSMRK